MENMNKKGIGPGGLLVLAIVMIALLIIAILGIGPVYSVWSKGLKGKAELKQAEWNKQIMIEDARARKDAAILIKETDIIRAEGVAAANAIISATLTDEYIRWKWVEGLHDGSSEVIYVPTEANLPILEARG